MALLPRLFRWWTFAGSVAAVARPALAGPLDPRTLRDDLEEQVLEGEIDAEDLAALRTPLLREGLRRGPHTYVALTGFVSTWSGGQREYGGFVILQLPLDRFLGVRSRERPGASVTSVTNGIGLDEVGVSWRLAPAGILEPSGGGPQRVPPSGPIVVTPDVARSCVKAAWRALAIGDDAAIDSMAQRARVAAALPEMRLRAARTLDQSGRVTVSDVDPAHYTEAGTATNWLEARLTFRLDRILFADDEVSLERIRLERVEARTRVTAKVLQALFEWQRAYALMQEPAGSTAEHFAAVLRELEASAILDVMTDGWFGRFRSSVGARSEH